MNMQGLSKVLFFLFMASVIFIGCKKEIEEKQVFDNIIYGMDTTVLYSSSAEKNKEKSSIQYISILYSDLFATTIPSNELSDLAELSLANGDKALVNELILSHYLKSASVNKPTDSEMRANVEQFVDNTYRIFYQRLATPYEKIYLTDLIESDPDMTVVEVYTSFILSNEYYYY